MISSNLTLPSSVLLSQSPTEFRVVSKIISKKNDDDALSKDFVGNPNLDAVESLNQLFEGINSFKTLPNMPIEAPNLVTECPVEVEFSSLGGFQIESFSQKNG